MARFLSPAWFDEIESARLAGGAGGGPGGAGGAGGADVPGGGPGERLVMKQVVTGTPDGEVSYVVVVEGERAQVLRSAPGDTTAEAQITITCDWTTATAIAQGRLSTQRALMQGRLRVRGSPNALLQRGTRLAGVDPIPAAIRKNTTY